MTKLFVLSNVADRFRGDFFPCGTHIHRNPCVSCEANLNGWSPPLLYWWEYEFGEPRSSLNAGHNCFWGGFRMMVDSIGQSMLSNLTIPFIFHPTTMTEGEMLFGDQSSLVCVTIDASIYADAAECKNAVCEKCGRFTERRRQITRLRIPASVIPKFGVFTIKQNGDTGPMFATEDARAELTNSGITGIGYYSAGRVI
jgi:hypothetical protein